MFKLKASLIFAVIAALVVAPAGFMKDVRLVTIALRSVAGFFAAGVVAYLVLFLLEAKKIVDFNVDEVPWPEKEGAESETTEEALGVEETAEEDGGQEGSAQEDHAEEVSEDFQPLDAQSLKHMETPPVS